MFLKKTISVLKTVVTTVFMGVFSDPKKNFVFQKKNPVVLTSI